MFDFQHTQKNFVNLETTILFVAGCCNRRLCLPVPPSLPEHHEVSYPAADGYRLQVRPDVVHRRIRQRSGARRSRLGREKWKRTQRRINQFRKLFYSSPSSIWLTFCKQFPTNPFSSNLKKIFHLL